MPSARQSESRSFCALSLVFLLFVLSLLVHDARAVGVSFTTPAAGATLPAGPITVTWTDAGGSPDMAALSTFELQLMVGGNEPSNSEVIATIGTPGSLVSTGQVQGTIGPNIAQSFENAFYFRMTSNTTDGNTVINYSDRFTLINMNGTTDSVYLDGANAVRGTDNVPAAQYNVVAQPTSTSTGASATTTVSSTATLTATETSEPTESDEGPGTGMLIGIVIGGFLALVGAVSLFVWAFMLYKHKKRKGKEQQRLNEHNNDLDRPRSVSQFGKVELPARNSLATPQSAYSTELSPIGVKHELEGDDGKPVEAARASIYELDSGWDGWEAMSGRKSKAWDPTDVV
ncbi:hypothetical protein CERZMDRAFT_83216 [Cercospora zeae-maydis SCOH1-5]|uniref:Yeast cell wall synthesis Kre9/Knh1-like N-terminal domain-containing protein n=1 Tax=Cercospora zeae-maydis SCOH1-5 TaxID=717836 RepID=A0A6A6FM60_9PEZI|nr:hypothetical protein CERZMDRAFT_83216 [Cercospora zeae-maydis SCOH1-5]